MQFWPFFKGRRQIRAALNKIKNMPGDAGADVVSFLKAIKVKFTATDQIKLGRYQTGLILEDDVWRPIPGTQKILLNTKRYSNPDCLIMPVLHEARHLRQTFNGLTDPNGFVSPAHLLRYTYFLEADAQSDAVIRMLKARLQGDSSAFEATYGIGYDEMLDAAKKGYEADPASLNDGRLRRMIFDAWFLSNLKTHYTQNLIQKGWEHFRKTCSERNMPRAKLAISELEKIGTTGNEGVNYLTLPGFRPLNDPYYLGNISDAEKESLKELTRAWKEMPSPLPLAGANKPATLGP